MKPKINTFLVGAQKAGTSSLYDWLGQHPAIWAPPEIKDYHFFSDDVLYSKGIQHIDSFYNRKNVSINIHAAVNYLYFHEKTAKRIYDYNPDAKIIICLRNPVERAISAYKYMYRVLRETNDFETAINKELNDQLSEPELDDKTYISHGQYVNQINTYLSYFGKPQIYFVFFEELVNKSTQKQVMQNMLRFFDIEKNFEFRYTHKNVSNKPRFRWLNYFLRKNNTINFKWLLPYKIRKRLYRMVEEMNISSKKIEVEMNSHLRTQLWLHFEKDMDELFKLIDRDVRKLWKKH